MISIIIPAYNEEKYLPETIKALKKSIAYSKTKDYEIILVDNNSTDKTRKVAMDFKLKVLDEPKRNISTVRNRGAKEAKFENLVFLDADTIVSTDTISKILEQFNNHFLAGSVKVISFSKRKLVNLYMNGWKLLALLLKMHQGACQFHKKQTFLDNGGFDESIFMGEDVIYFWELKKKKPHIKTIKIKDTQVYPSNRKWDTIPIWQLLIETNPLMVLFFKRRIETWKSWYAKPLR